MFLIPNLNSAAMEPVDPLAGTASALTGAARLAGGGRPRHEHQCQITVRPFAIGIAGMCFACGIAALIERIGQHRRQRVYLPVADTRLMALAERR